MFITLLTQLSIAQLLILVTMRFVWGLYTVALLLAGRMDAASLER
jgi:hypothetical protein